MMVGIDLVAHRGRAGSPREPFEPARRTGDAVRRTARDRGVIIRPLEDIIVLMPAPAMDTATLERLLDVTIESVRTIVD